MGEAIGARSIDLEWVQATSIKLLGSSFFFLVTRILLVARISEEQL